MHTPSKPALAVLMIFSAGIAQAQSGKAPVAQAWIDVATFSGMAMPGMGGEGMNPMAMLGGMFGGGGGPNSFGRTQSGSAGSWLDVTLSTRDNPNLAEAMQSVPKASKLDPELKLVSPKQKKAAPRDDDEVIPEQFERPKGKIYLYWGCGDTVRAGQPRVLDMAKASPSDYAKFFVGRRATQRGAHLANGRPVWPNEQDDRLVPKGASLVGEHGFQGQGVPADFRFNLGPNQDIMPAIDLKQRDLGGATRLEWKGLPTARGYFISAMGARSGSDMEMVFWSSSELPDTGTGLVDYQTNAAVDRWLKEKVLLSPDARDCTVPKGVFGEGAMTRMIAYGSEFNVVHPPRPADPKKPWNPQWAAKVRVKSVANAMLGMESMLGGSRGAQTEDRGSGREYTSTTGSAGSAAPAADPIGSGLNKLKGLFGF